MRQVLRAMLIVGVAAVLIAPPSPASGAPGTPEVRVAPSRALQDGQVIAVFGSGFTPAGNIIGLAQCRAGGFDDLGTCVGQQVVDSNGGSFVANFQVRRFVGATDCAAAPGACVIGASNLNGVTAFTQQAVARLRFGPRATVLQSTLTGFREIGPDGAPGAGDVDGVGAATLAVRDTSLCASLSVTEVDLPAVAAHVHEAARGANGPIVIPLKPPGARGRSQACVADLDPALLARLVSQPRQFYVNVHTSAFPNGAVRGQLQRADLEGALLAAQLSGANEIGPDGQPGVGDEDGEGVATVTVHPEEGRVCFQLSVSGITLPALAAHIHEGRPTLNGGIVVTLEAPDAAGRSSGCVLAVDALLVSDLFQNPGAYYVNVHTTDFPDGAVRGQLAPAAALAG
jgi:CHRD domain